MSLSDLFRKNGEKRVRSASINYVEVPDEKDDGHFPHQLHLIRGTRRMDSEKREELRQQGLRIREGIFNAREKKQIRRNFKRIMRSERISSFWTNEDEYQEVGCTLLGMFRKIPKPMGLTLNDILGEADTDDPLFTPRLKVMYELGRGLPYRPLNNIVYQAKWLCVNLRPRSSFTDKERRKICKLRRRGVRELELGWKFKSHPNTMKEIIRTDLTPGLQWVKKEPFSYKEDRRLIRLVKRRQGIQWISQLELDAERYRDMNWPWIAMRMPLRSISQCRNRFFGLLRLRDTYHMQLLERPKFEHSSDLAKIIRFLQDECDEGVTRELGIDWSALKVRIRHQSLPELMYLFNELMSHVPSEVGTDFVDRVDWLRENMLPKLMRKSRTSPVELDDWIWTPLTLTGTIAS